MTIYLITGANRGLGKAMVATYLSSPQNTVIAAVRSPAAATETLNAIPKNASSKLIIVKIESSSETDAHDAVQVLLKDHGITEIDVVIGNAGISKVLPTAAEAKSSDMIEHFAVNVVGNAILFQATLPLLKASKLPKFVTISSAAGSIGYAEFVPFPNCAYGLSKAALNYYTRKIHFENEWLIAFPLSPGFVMTDMGLNGAKELGIDVKIMTTIDDSVAGLTKVIDTATREKTSGNFLTEKGGILPW